MKYRLYKNADPDAVRRRCEDGGRAAGRGAPMPDSTRRSEARLVAGVRQRGAGADQKARAASRRDMGIDPSRPPPALVVAAEKRRSGARDSEQGYAAVVTLEHSSGIDLYSALKAANRARARGGTP